MPCFIPAEVYIVMGAAGLSTYGGASLSLVESMAKPYSNTPLGAVIHTAAKVSQIAVASGTLALLGLIINPYLGAAILGIGLLISACPIIEKFSDHTAWNIASNVALISAKVVNSTASIFLIILSFSESAILGVLLGLGIVALNFLPLALPDPHPAKPQPTL